MKSKFNYSLFKDGFKQLRAIGIMTFIIYSIEAFFCVLSEQISLAEYYKDLYMNGSPVRSNYLYFYERITVHNLLELHPILIATCYVVVPIMILFLFSFLNKRNTSDFYHSIPVKRECLCISYLASIFAWILLIVMGSTAITCITVACCSYVKINISSIFISTAAILVAALCTLGAGLLAMSLTGTYFSNFSVSLMILAFPRLIIMVFMSILSSIIEIIDFNLTSTIFDYRLNIVLGTFFNGLFSNDVLYSTENILPIIYTFVLALVYMGLGIFFFVRRRSEIATMPASNSKVQLLFRLIPAIAISFIPIGLISQIIWDEQELDADTILAIVVLYIIVLLTYFLYELISSRKLSVMLASAKQLWILILSNIVFLVLIGCGRAVILNNVPVASEVSYVQISNDNSSSSNYFSEMRKNVKITDPNVIADTTSALSYTVNAVKTNSRFRYKNGSATVKFKVGARTIERKIYFDTLDSYNKLQYDLANCDDYINIYRNLPEFDKIKDINLFAGGEKLSLSNSDLREIYECYVEDCQNIPGSVLLDESGTSPYYDQAYFSGTYSTLTSNYRFNMYVGKSEKTLLMIMDKVNSMSDKNLLREFLNTDLSQGNAYSSRSFTQAQFRLITKEGKVYYDQAQKDFYGGEYAEFGYNYTAKGKEVLNQMADILDSSSDNITSLDNSILLISYCPPYSDRSIDYIQHYYIVNDEFVELFRVYTGEDRR